MTESKMRELDEEMHRICGWVFDESRKCWHRGGFWTADSGNYTTDPAAAMEVLEKCFPELESIEIWKSRDEFFVSFSGRKYGCYETAMQKTLPLAICDFARRNSDKIIALQ